MCLLPYAPQGRRTSLVGIPAVSCLLDRGSTQLIFPVGRASLASVLAGPNASIQVGPSPWEVHAQGEEDKEKRGDPRKRCKKHCCFGYHFKMSRNQTPWLLDGLCSLGKGALVQTGYKVETHLGVRSPHVGERRGLTSPAACSLPLSTGQGYATGRDLEVVASFGRSVHSGSRSVAPASCAVWDETGLRSGPRETGSGCAL